MNRKKKNLKEITGTARHEFNKTSSFQRNKACQLAFSSS
uniref:Transcriptional regulator n=1 Tax=Ascaris lumbricoides TaxID=6252 RepID=A0A0M3HLH7_ASCLU